MLGDFGGRPGLRRLLVSYLAAASLRCQASSVAGVTGKPLSSARGEGAEPARGTKPCQQARTVSGQSGGAALRPRGGAPATQQPSPGRRGPPGQPRRVPARQQIDDLEQHPPSAITMSSLLAIAQVSRSIEYSGGTRQTTGKITQRGSQRGKPSRPDPVIEPHRPAPAGQSSAHVSTVLAAGRGPVLEPPAGPGMPARKCRTSWLAAWVASVM